MLFSLSFEEPGAYNNFIIHISDRNIFGAAIAFCLSSQLHLKQGLCSPASGQNHLGLFL